ncbi:MAG: hypothetical protein WC538_24800 [Thermoanaerobaculia bacterium]|jgi:hypothetical protein
MDVPAPPFPFDESFIDASGKHRRFRIDGDPGPLCWVLIAREIDPDDEGYEFQSSSESNWGLALGKLRSKIRRELATRYLAPNAESPELLHDILRGYISCDRAGKAILVVDGRAVSIEQLGEVLATHEGFTFQLTITDPSG